MYKKLVLLCGIGLVSHLSGVAVAGAYSGGSGTPDDPYQIATAQDLIALGQRWEDYDKCFLLTTDIDLGIRTFNRAMIWSFAGVFDGGGHLILNLTIRGDSYLGLFGRTEPEAHIRNLGLEEVMIQGDGDYVGALAGQNSGSINDCYSTVTVTGGSRVGGLAGMNNGSVANCYSTGTVAGEGSGVGGLVGEDIAGTISACHSSSSVTGLGDVGGLVGQKISGLIVASYSDGMVVAEVDAGGLVGYNYSGAMIACYSTAAVRGGFEIGGLVGWNTGSIHACYSRGVVEGRSIVGGLVGGTPDGVTSCFWDTEASGQTTSGGGTGLKTAQMKEMSTFLSAGWDSRGESANGTSNYWYLQEGHYPQLGWQIGPIPYLEGHGTADVPYVIRDANDLGTLWFRPTRHYRLNASLDLSGTTWLVAPVPWFDGWLDGQGHTIGHLCVTGDRYVGFIGRLSRNGRVSNLNLVTTDIQSQGNSVGALIGVNQGMIMNCHTEGTVSGGGSIGGLAGMNSGLVVASFHSGIVTGEQSVGGLVGTNAGSITISFSAGAITGIDCVGGLIGYGHNDWGGRPRTVTALQQLRVAHLLGDL